MSDRPRILVVGAAGFIGRHVARALQARGADLVVHARTAQQLAHLFPKAPRHGLDLAHADDPASWRPLLEGVNAVVMAAGIMGERGGDTYEAVHVAAMQGLLAACAEMGVRRVVLVSASGAGTSPQAYWSTKGMAEERLAELGKQGTLAGGWAIVRPSVVVGRGGASDALFRGLAALPVSLRVMGDPGRLRPIHASDLAAAIAELLLQPRAVSGAWDAGGPETLTMHEVTARYRASLGLPPALVLPLPLAGLVGLARLASAFGAPPPLHAEAVRLLALAPEIDPEPLAAATGVRPRPLGEVLAEEAAGRGDLAEARSAFLGLLGRLALAALWLGSGLVSLSPFARPSGPALLAEVGVTGGLAKLLLWGAAGADIAVGIAILRNWRPLLMGIVQLGLIAVFTLILTIQAPAWWLHPFGPLLKNLPVAALVLVVMAREGGRWTRSG